MERLRNWCLKSLLRLIDRLLDVRMDNPVYIVFLGEGVVQIQKLPEPCAKTIQL